MRIVVALGGNALLERGEAPDADIQEHHVRIAAEALAPLVLEARGRHHPRQRPSSRRLGAREWGRPRTRTPLPIRLLGRRDPRSDRELAPRGQSNTPPRATKRCAC